MRLLQIPSLEGMVSVAQQNSKAGIAGFFAQPGMPKQEELCPKYALFL